MGSGTDGSGTNAHWREDMTRPRDAEEERAEQESQRIRSHTLLTKETCDYDHEALEPRGCPVCDWGLGVCSVCSAAEIELSQYTCAEYTALHQNGSKDTTESENQG